MQTPKLPELARTDQHPSYRTALDQLQALEKRLSETEARRRRAQARLRGTKSPRSPLERAKDLLAGGQIGAVDPADDARACDEEEFSVLRPAIVAATAQLDDIAGNLSFAASEKLRPHYTAAVKAALQAMTDLAAALDTLAALRNRLRERGYTPSEGRLPSGIPSAATALGSPSAVGASQAWFWLDHMQRHGVI